MADNKFSCSGSAAAREAFGIEAGRILDACRDRDCFEDVRVYLTEVGEELISRTGSVRVKKACISGANIQTQPIQFNSGFYAVDVKFYVNCTFEVCVPLGTAQEFEGVAVVEKRVVLYGGECNVNVFRSSESVGYCTLPETVTCSKKSPEAVVEVLDPIVLGARIVECASECHCCCCCCDIPCQICDQLNGELTDGEGNRFLAVSLGFFSVIRLLRNGQFLIQGSEYCLPEKECTAPCEDNPCATFDSIPFPAGEFCGCTAPASVGPVQQSNRRCCGNS